MSDNVRAHRDAASSAVITGGSQLLTALLALVRTKFAALWIGPEGVGLLGLLNQLQNVLTTGFDLGVSNSAVRDISILRSGRPLDSRSHVVSSLYHLTKWAALSCLVAVAALSAPISAWMMSSDGFEWHVVAIAVSAALLILAGYHTILMRGHGMVVDLALQRILISVASTLFAFIGYRLYGIDAIAWVIVATAAMTWWIAVIQSKAVRRELSTDQKPAVGALVMQGLPFLWSALAFSLVSYIVGVRVVDECGLAIGGNYQAAWGMTSYLVGFVLIALGQDFLPRLSAIVHDGDRARQAISAQLEIGLLMAFPGMFLFSVMADQVVPVALSSEFDQAIVLTQWVLVGCLGRVVNWPLLIALNAQGKVALHAQAVTGASIIYLISALYGLHAFGAIGAVGGFVLMQALHHAWLRLVLLRTMDLRLRRSTSITIGLSFSMLCLAPFLWVSVGLGLFLCLLAVCMWRLSLLTGKGSAMRSRLLDFVRIIRSKSEPS